MTSHYEIINLTETHDLVVFVYVGNVGIVVRVFDFGQEVVVTLVELAAFVDHRGITVHLAVMDLNIVRRNYDVFVLIHQLFGAIQFLFVELVVHFPRVVNVTDLRVGAVFCLVGVVRQQT